MAKFLADRPIFNFIYLYARFLGRRTLGRPQAISTADGTDAANCHTANSASQLLDDGWSQSLAAGLRHPGQPGGSSGLEWHHAVVTAPTD